MVELGMLLASDPRRANARHELSEVLFIGFAAVPCGRELRGHGDFGASKETLLGESWR